MFVLPFAIGLILAYLIRPIVGWLERRLPPRHKWPGFRRVISVLIGFLIILVFVGGFLYVVTTAVIDASLELIEYAPYFFSQGFVEVQNWIENVISVLPLEVQESLSNELLGTGFSIGTAVRDFLLNAVPSIPRTLNLILGFAILPFFMFYILKDREFLQMKVTTVFSDNVNRHIKAVLSIIENVVGRYLRAQIMLGLIVGYFTLIGLFLLGVRSEYVLALALLAGVTELIPTVGPWIGGSVAGIVTLATTPEKTVWVILLFIAIQLLENNLLVPKIQSAYLGIHPAIMIVLLVFGAYIAGFWGILIIGPLTALLVQLGKYVFECLNAPEAETAVTE